MVDVNAIKRKLEVPLKRFFKSEGYTLSEIETSNLYTLRHEHHKSEQYTDFYIYAEMSVEEFFRMSESLDSVIETIDPSAYFDVVSPGIYMTRVYWASSKSENVDISDILTKRNLNKFGDHITSLLDESFDDDFWVDDIRYNKSRNKLSIEVSSQDSEASTEVKIDTTAIASYEDLVDLYSGNIYLSLENELKGVE